jgi:hypothetical protein
LIPLRQLEEDILRATGNRYERAVAIGAAGQVLLVVDGTTGEVRFSSDEWAQLRGATDLLIHNHPSGGGLSVTDFELAHFLNVREVVAFGSVWRYRASRTSDRWLHLGQAKQVLSVQQEQVRQYLQARVDAGSLTPREASTRFWHEVWTRFASHSSEIHYRREVR